MPKPISGTVSRTLILLKPDAIERNLSGEILKRFERKGLKIVAAEMRWIDKDLAEQHYAEHKGNTPHFTNMTNAITRGPLMAVVLEGIAAVHCSRQIIGSQSPLYHSTVGTIRADFAIEEPYNLVHGSDSDGAAKREITLWFGPSMVKANQKPKIATIMDEKLQVIMPPPMPKIPKKVDAPTPEDISLWKDQAIKFLQTEEGIQFDMASWMTQITKPVKVK